jgi:hypothetical protein
LLVAGLELPATNSQQPLKNMKLLFAISCVLASIACVGCAVHDGHEDEPAPIWWPTFLYRATTHPTTEEWNQTNASPMSPAQGDSRVAIAAVS